MIISEEKLRFLIKEKLKNQGNYQVKTGSRSNSDDDAGNVVPCKFNFKEIKTPDFANNAKKEYSAWKKGKLKEGEEAAYPLLKKYWDSIVSNKWPESRWKPTETPWSAAFITYVTLKDKFFDSAAHITWKDKAVNHTELINKDPEKYKGKIYYVALDAKKYKPEVGNNVWRPRDGGSHSDIVISPTQAIGGNLSNSVSITKINHPIVIKKVKILGKIS